MRASVPAKVFLLGEYAVLAGLPAALVAIGPRFSAETAPNSGEGAGSDSVAPRSPWGKLEAHARTRLPLKFSDPFRGAGGFGASTAQFALAYASWHGMPEFNGSGAEIAGARAEYAVQAWKLYRELGSDEPVPPSGADLVAQIQGGATVFDPTARACASIPSGPGAGIRWDSFLVFSATGQEGRKVATHVHLPELASGKSLESGSVLIRALERPLREGLQALERGDTLGLGRAMHDYGRALWSQGLEIEATSRDRFALGMLPGVLAIKGAGALQADALVALIDPALEGEAAVVARRKLIEEAANRGLKLVCDGIRPEEGLRGA